MQKFEPHGNLARLPRLSSFLPFLPLYALWLAGCAVQPAAAPVAVAIPAQWQAPLPHNGSLTGLAQWWQQQNDPLLVELIMAAEAVSPSIASALSNIEQARAARVASAAALLPTLDATACLTRSRSPPINRAAPPIATTGQAGLQASWEIDLFGQYSASRDADQQRLEGSQALWHAARVSVAAEVANQYYSLRACEKLLTVARADAASRLETARLAELSARAGFQAPANAAPEVPPPVVSVPAEVLAQRPDIFNAAREVDAAHAEVDSARATLPAPESQRLHRCLQINNTRCFTAL